MCFVCVIAGFYFLSGGEFWYDTDEITFWEPGGSTQYSRIDGIKNDMVHGILEDSDGCVWLSTNKGLTKYNPHNRFFIIMKS